MYRDTQDTVSVSRAVYLNAKEFRVLEEFVLDQLDKSTSPELATISSGDCSISAKGNLTISGKVESPSPDLDNIQAQERREQLFTDLCDRIKELESWREGADPGQLHSQFPITNIIALQNRVASIEQQLTDLAATVTQHKAEQDNLDKLGSSRHNKAHLSTLRNRLSGVEQRLTTWATTIMKHINAIENKIDKSSRLEDIEERITYIVERITTLEHNT